MTNNDTKVHIKIKWILINCLQKIGLEGAVSKSLTSVRNVAKSGSKWIGREINDFQNYYYLECIANHEILEYFTYYYNRIFIMALPELNLMTYENQAHNLTYYAIVSVVLEALFVNQVVRFTIIIVRHFTSHSF